MPKATWRSASPRIRGKPTLGASRKHRAPSRAAPTLYVGELKGSRSFEETSRREAAVAAVRCFSETGEADSHPTWFTSTEACVRRPLPS